MFVISVEYVKSMEEIEAHLVEHRAFLDKCYAAGYFMGSGRKVPPTGGIILAKALSREKVEALVTEDPFYINGIAKYEITEFEPSKFSEKFKAALE